MNNLNLSENYPKKLTLKEKIKSFTWKDWLKYYIIYFIILALIHIQIGKQFNFDSKDYITFVFIFTLLIHLCIKCYLGTKGFHRYLLLCMWVWFMIRMIIDTFIGEFVIITWISYSILIIILVSYLIAIRKEKKNV